MTRGEDPTADQVIGGSALEQEWQMRRWAIISSAVSVALIAACGSSNGNKTSTSPPTATQPASAAATPLRSSTATPSGSPAVAQAGRSGGYPVTVKNCGRTLTFDKAPSRVVTGYEPAFEDIVALGLGDRIIGRANFTDQSPNAGFPPGDFKQVYDSLPEVSPTIKLPTKEKLLSLHPDFVIDSNPGTFDASQGYATLQELDANKAPGYITGGDCGVGPETNVTVAALFDDIRNLGAIFGVQDRAAALIAKQRAVLDDVRQRVGSLKPVRVLSTDGGSGPVHVQGAGLVTEMITAAGGMNIFGDVQMSYFSASAEQVAASNPDAMLVEDYVSSSNGVNLTAQVKADMVFPIIKNSSPAQQKRYLAVSAVADHPGYRTVPEIEEIARFLHPEAFQ